MTHEEYESIEPASKADAVQSGSEAQFTDGEAAPADDGLSDRPKGLPEKFWDPENGEILTDTLIGSYRELEQRLGGPNIETVPKDPTGYQIKIEDHPGMEISDDVNSRLHAAGFTGTQAQLVYDLAAEYLPAMNSEIGAKIAHEADLQRLVERHGGEKEWNETAAQTFAWGKANLPQQAFDSLASTFDGVRQIQQLMGSSEPHLVNDSRNSNGPLSEESLKALMQDPRYWRDHDPAIVDQVTRGFEALYPNKG